jgi:hypothetical protein
LLATAAVAAVVTGSLFGPSVARGHAGSGTASPVAALTDPGSEDVNLVAFSPDGRTLATADQNGRTYPVGRGHPYPRGHPG